MSFLFADPGELYAVAERISRHADAVRSNATTLAAAAANDRWHGLASEVFSAEAGSLLRDMRACAGRLDDAADALRRHAGRVKGAFDEIKKTWHDVEEFGATVVHDVAGVVDDTLSVVGL
jgi:uncharacterized protein YukE